MRSDADNSSSTRPSADLVQEPEEAAECNTDAPLDTTESNYEQLQEADDLFMADSAFRETIVDSFGKRTDHGR